MSPTPARAQPARGALKAAAVVLLVLHLGLGWTLRSPGVTAGGDDAAYTLLGRSVRHFHYDSFWLIGDPPHGQYPPAFPALLALSTASEPGRAPLGVAVNLILSTAALGLFALLCWRWSPPAAVGALGIAAVNPATLDLAGRLMSEPLFMLLLVLALWCVVARPARWPLAALAAVAAALTRGIGVAVIAGLLLEWVRIRRWPPAFGLALAALVTLGPWFMRAASVPQQLAGQSYIGDALYRRRAPVTPPPSVKEAPSVPDSSAVARAPSVGPLQALGFVVRRAGASAALYASRTVPALLAVPTLPGTRVDNLLWVILLVGLGVVGVVTVVRLQPLLPIMAACYFGVLLLWPYVVGRFLVPVLPLLAFFVMEGARRVGGVARLPSWASVGLLSGVLMISGLVADRRELGTRAHCERARAYETEGCFNPTEAAFFQTIADANRMAPAGAVFLTPKPPAVFYFTGHLTIDDVYAASLTADELDAYLRRNKVDFALLSRVHQRFGGIGTAMRPHCSDWRLLVNREHEGSVLLRRREGPDTTASSCAVLARIDLTGGE